MVMFDFQCSVACDQYREPSSDWLLVSSVGVEFSGRETQANNGKSTSLRTVDESFGALGQRQATWPSGRTSTAPVSSTSDNPGQTFCSSIRSAVRSGPIDRQVMGKAITFCDAATASRQVCPPIGWVNNKNASPSSKS